jgi:hypothetical protein
MKSLPTSIWIVLFSTLGTKQEQYFQIQIFKRKINEQPGKGTCVYFSKVGNIIQMQYKISDYLLLTEQRENVLPKLRAEVLRRIEANQGVQSSIMDEIRGVDFKYTPSQKNENIPLLLSCEPISNNLVHFKLIFNNSLKSAAEFPVLPLVLSMIEEIKIIR